MILAPLLIVTGIAGFVLPEGYSLIWSAIQDKGRWKSSRRPFFFAKSCW
jgi:hypothetical protein